MRSRWQTSNWHSRIVAPKMPWTSCVSTSCESGTSWRSLLAETVVYCCVTLYVGLLQQCVVIYAEHCMLLQEKTGQVSNGTIQPQWFWLCSHLKKADSQVVFPHP
mmetsp:Transcript_6378/g.13941  ORF Transcript_6378/g.13941 Transcript_6378/m.13941 type:complete len:105 (+) Transcript_6378:218-532(+)